MKEHDILAELSINKIEMIIIYIYNNRKLMYIICPFTYKKSLDLDLTPSDRIKVNFKYCSERSKINETSK